MPEGSSDLRRQMSSTQGSYYPHVIIINLVHFNMQLIGTSAASLLVCAHDYAHSRNIMFMNETKDN